MKPWPSNATLPAASARVIKICAAAAARVRAALKLSTPADQPHSHAVRASVVQTAGRSRRRDVMAQGNAGSRKWSSINGTTAGAMSRADSIDRRRGLAMRQRASRISCSRSAPGGGRCTGSSAASRSPSSH